MYRNELSCSRPIASQDLEKSSEFYSFREPGGEWEGQKMCFPNGGLFGTLWIKRCPPVVGFVMLRTDLDTPLLTSPSYAARPVSHFVRLTCSGILIISCTVFG